jgi:MoxR-like ATPase
MQAVDAVVANVEKVIVGKKLAVQLAVTALLAESHLLLEDVPGVGKTTLAKALARSLDCTVQRVQFTPDLLPSDITGVSIYRGGEFEFRPGGIFANIVIADEINRASPKTQSALLEAMEERRVTVDGTTHALPRPFLVFATENPIEMEGTFPLPESQRDRFGMKLQIGYPSLDAELAILDAREWADPLDALQPVVSRDAIARAINAVHQIYVDERVKKYLIAIVAATRNSADTRIGASPRASLQMIRLARAYALIQGRDYVIPDDVQTLAVPVLGHRILLSSQALLARRPVEQIVEQAVASVPVPTRQA